MVSVSVHTERRPPQRGEYLHRVPARQRPDHHLDHAPRGRGAVRREVVLHIQEAEERLEQLDRDGARAGQVRLARRRLRVHRQALGRRAPDFSPQDSQSVYVASHGTQRQQTGSRNTPWLAALVWGPRGRGGVPSALWQRPTLKPTGRKADPQGCLKRRASDGAKHT